MSSEPLTSRPIRRIGIATSVALQVMAAALLLAIVNYLAYRHYWRWDLTRTSQYTVSDQTRSFLKSLRGRTEVVAAFPRGSEDEKEVRALMDEYRRHAKSRLVVDYIDLAGEPSRALEIGKKYNVALNRNGIIVSKDTTPKSKPGEGTAAPTVPAAVPASPTSPTSPTSPPVPPSPPAPSRRTRFLAQDQLFSYDDSTVPRRISEFRGEDLLTSALISVNQKRAPVVYLLTGNIGNLPSVMATDGIPRNAANVLLDIATKQGLELRQLSLTGAASIPADAGALVSLRAGLNFTEREIGLVREYWEQRKGAGLLVLMDPEADLSRLDALLTQNGVSPRSDRVLKLVTTAQGPRKELLVEAAFNPNAPITARFGGRAVTLGGPSESLRLEEDPARRRAASIEVTPLMAARSDYWGELRYHEDEPRRDDADVGDPQMVVLAAAVEMGAQRDERLGAFSSRLVVVGNATLLDPDPGTGRVNPVTYDFVSSSLNWILNREELIGITSKRAEAFHIALGPGATTKILWICLGLLPAVVMTFALFMWSVRRA